MHYYQKNIKDWIVATAHLTPEEEGVYNRLIDYYYDTESPIPEETESVIRRLRLRGYEDTVALILEEFFVLEGGRWRHHRCDLEIEAYCQRAERARKNGRKGGRPPKDKGAPGPGSPAPKPGDNPEETQSVIGENPEQTQAKAPNTQEPIPNTQEPKERGSDADAPPPAGEKPKSKSRGTRLPDDWALTDEHYTECQRLRPELLPHIDTVAGKFADHWRAQPGQKGVKVDWMATWRNWLRNEKAPRAQAPPSSNELRGRTLIDDLTDRSWAGTG